MRQTCILKLILPLVVVLLLQHTQFSFSCNFNHQSHTHSSFLYTSLHFSSLPLLWFAWFSHGMCAIPYVWDDESFLFLLHKMQEFLVFIQFLSHLLCHRYRSYCCCFFRSTHTHTHVTLCVKHLQIFAMPWSKRWYDPNDLPRESEKLFKWLSCTAWSLSSHLWCLPNERTEKISIKFP